MYCSERCSLTCALSTRHPSRSVVRPPPRRRPSGPGPAPVTALRQPLCREKPCDTIERRFVHGGRDVPGSSAKGEWMYGSYDRRLPRAARARRLASGAAVGAMLLLAGCSSSSDDSSGDGSGGGSAVGQRPKSESPFWVNPDSERRQTGQRVRRGRQGRRRPAGKEDRGAAGRRVDRRRRAAGRGDGFTKAAAKADRERAARPLQHPAPRLRAVLPGRRRRRQRLPRLAGRRR